MYELKDMSGKNDTITNLGVTVGEWLLCDVLFYLFARSEAAASHVSLVQTLTLFPLLYACCLALCGIALSQPKVFARQIVSSAIKTLVLFAVATLILSHIGGFFLPTAGTFSLFLLTFALFVLAFRLSLRKIIGNVRREPKYLRQTILVGGSSTMLRLVQSLTEDATSCSNVCGYFAEEPNADFEGKATYLGEPETAVAYLSAHTEVRACFCELPDAQGDTTQAILHYCENHLVRFYSVPTVSGSIPSRVYPHAVGNSAYLSLRNEPLESLGNRVLKRAFDIVFSLLVICFIFPFILVIVAFVTKITMPGPIFFSQKRTGLYGREFNCFKFRSMRLNDEADEVQATKNDPRKTRWGKFLRKTSLDEMPQFVNVLLGNMSVVGPRPHMIKHTEEYSALIDKYMVRHFVKPGITGWSQVTGFRGEIKQLSQMMGRIKGDIWYIEHWNFWLDLRIIYLTLVNAIRGEEKAC